MRRLWRTATSAAVLSFAVTGYALADGLPFSDIGGTWYEQEVAQAYQQGWVNGYPDGTFRGEQTVTRGQFLKFITSGLQIDRQPGDEQLDRDTFPDADQMSDVGVWRLGAAIRLGVIIPEDYRPPVGSGSFGPKEPITRREATVQVERALGHTYLAKKSEGEQVSFPDVNVPWFRGYVYQATKDGIIKGYPDGLFREANTLNRAEAIVMVRHARDYQNSLGIQETGYDLVVAGHRGPTVQYKGELYVPIDMLVYTYQPNFPQNANTVWVTEGQRYAWVEEFQWKWNNQVVSKFPVVVWSPTEQQCALLSTIGPGGYAFDLYVVNAYEGTLKKWDTFTPDDPFVHTTVKALQDEGMPHSPDFLHIAYSAPALYYHGHVYIPAGKWGSGHYGVPAATLIIHDEDKTFTIEPNDIMIHV